MRLASARRSVCRRRMGGVSTSCSRLRSRRSPPRRCRHSGRARAEGRRHRPAERRQVDVDQSPARRESLDHLGRARHDTRQHPRAVRARRQAVRAHRHRRYSPPRARCRRRSLREIQCRAESKAIEDAGAVDRRARRARERHRSGRASRRARRRARPRTRDRRQQVGRARRPRTPPHRARGGAQARLRAIRELALRFGAAWQRHRRAHPSRARRLQKCRCRASDAAAQSRCSRMHYR